MASWNNNFPSWGDTGEQPPQNKNYGAEQVNEKHFDYLWDQLNKTFDEIQAHTIQDDGSVPMDGDLDMGNNNIDNIADIEFATWEDPNSDARIRFFNGGLDIDVNFGGDGNFLNALNIDTDGNVEIPSGGLNMRGNSINSVDSISLSGGLDMGGSNIDGFNALLDDASNSQLLFSGGTLSIDADNGAGSSTEALSVRAGSTAPPVRVNYGLEFGSGGARVYLDSGHLKIEDNLAEIGSIISDGDEVQRQIWVIANGAADPAGADADDIILEKEA